MSVVRTSPVKGRHRAGRSRYAAALRGLLAGALVWLLGWLALIAGQLGQPHNDNRWVEGAYSLKRAAAEQLSGAPKLLVVGGSASMFGVDSQQLAARLDWPAVNFGVNAGVGTTAVPGLADAWIKKGDVVVLPLEYRLLLWDGIPSYVTLTWAMEHPQVLRGWGWRTWFHALWKLSLRRVYEGYRDADPAAINAGPYGPHRLDPWGNQTRSSASERTSVQLNAVSSLPAESFVDRLSTSKTGLNEWSNWWQKWSQRGACVLVVPPPLLWHPDYDRSDWREFFNNVPARVRAAGGRYLGSPAETFFTVESMFDTNYHLTAEARRSYTDWLADLLAAEAADCVAGN